MRRFFYLISIISIISLTSLVFLKFFLLDKKTIFEKDNKAALISQLFEKEKEDSKIVILSVGDIILDRGVEYMVKKYGSGDFKFPFLKIVDDLKKSDILLGNLESVISDKGVKVGSIYSFRAEPESMDGLIYSGFDILSVANNHIFDYSREAMEDSFERLKKSGIDYVGGGFSEKEARSGITKEIKETKICFLAYTNKGSKYWQAGENSSGILWLDERIKDDIRKAKEKNDLVIVSLHWGEEYQGQPSEEQKYFGRMAIDSGADLIIGHHPHVIQPIEKYKNGWIAYSLGNFIFDQYFSEETMKGLMLEVIVENKKIKEVIPREIRISEKYQPLLINSNF
jgi:poly-gamma-glutamate synthesis protein (capsule biosynthesis protein)